MTNSSANGTQIQHFESAHPNIYSIYKHLELVEKLFLQNQMPLNKAILDLLASPQLGAAVAVALSVCPVGRSGRRVCIVVLPAGRDEAAQISSGACIWIPCLASRSS